MSYLHLLQCLEVINQLRATTMHLISIAVAALFAPSIQGLVVSSWDASTEAQLTPDIIGDFGAVTFGDVRATPSSIRQRCKAFPGDTSWPTENEWSRLNKTVGGALLHPLPPASVCYRTSPNFNTEACSFLANNASGTTFYLDDPVTILSQWPQGNTCLLSQDPPGNCTRGGYPVYVVNATSVKHVQAAINFARNKNVRLVIKFVLSERNGVAHS